jgi:hypothetical protein
LEKTFAEETFKKGAVPSILCSKDVRIKFMEEPCALGGIGLTSPESSYTILFKNIIACEDLVCTLTRKHHLEVVLTDESCKLIQWGGRCTEEGDFSMPDDVRNASPMSCSVQRILRCSVWACTALVWKAFHQSGCP